MKRVIEKYDREFVKDGKRIFCTAIHIPYSEIPADCDYKGHNVRIINIMYGDCHINISGFDKNQNHICIDIPDNLKHMFFVAMEQGYDRCITLLQKAASEINHVANRSEIPYDNVVGSGGHLHS